MRIVKVRVGQSEKHERNPNFHYCGRAFGGFSGSNLGNPFKVGADGTLTEVLVKYETWLREKAAGRNEVREELDTLTADSVLGCWCCNKLSAGGPPHGCHCDVIAVVWGDTRGTTVGAS